MAAGMNPCRVAPRLAAAAILALSILGAAVPDATAQNARELYAEGLRAQQAGDLPRAADRFAAASRLAPANTEILLRLALVRGYMRDYEGALAATDRGLAIDPQSADLRLARARILGWAGRYAEAGTVADVVIATRPTSAEAHAVRGRIAFYTGDLDVAQAHFARAQSLDSANEEARVGLADVARARRPPEPVSPGITSAAAPRRAAWRYDTGYSQSRLSRPALDDWHEGFFRVERTSPGGTGLHLRADVSNRFDDTDTSVGLGIAQRFSPALRAYLEGAIAPEADFLPRWAIATGGGARLYSGGDAIGPGFLTLDLRHRSYETADVQNADPGLEQYFFDGRVWLTGRWINSFDRETDERLAGWFGRLDWQIVPAFRIYGGAADAPETESGITVQTSSWFGGMAFDLPRRIRVSLDVAREDRENSYIREVFAVGLTVRH